MIEITANGDLYIANYFMPRSDPNATEIIVPYPYWAENIHFEIDINLREAPKLKTWVFSRVLTHRGDIRWKFEGSINEYAKIIKWLLERQGKYAFRNRRE